MSVQGEEITKATPDQAPTRVSHSGSGAAARRAIRPVKSIPKKRAVTKKRRNHPKRALSAYNYFVREERARILQESSHVHRNIYESGKDPGKVFAAVGRLVAERWKQISKEELERYKRMADKDMERYQRDMQHHIVEEVGTDNQFEADAAEAKLNPVQAPMSEFPLVDHQSILQGPFAYPLARSQLFANPVNSFASVRMTNESRQNDLFQQLFSNMQQPLPPLWPIGLLLQSPSYNAHMLATIYREDHLAAARLVALLQHQLAYPMPLLPQTDHMYNNECEPK